MNACKDHWTKMRAKIEALGLMHLVSATGHDAVERVIRALEAGTENPQDFDPLMAMSNSIFMRVSESAGPMLLFSRDPEGKPWCPLCLVRQDFERHNTPTGKCDREGCTIVVKPGDVPWDDAWIESCGNAQLTYAKDKGLVRIN